MTGPVRPARRRAAMLGAGALALVLGVLVWSQTRPVQAGAGAVAAPAVPVATALAKRRDLDLWLQAIGTVTPINVVAMKTRVGGQLQRVDFVEGQTVRQGDLLAQLDPRPYRALLAQAEATAAKDQALAASGRVEQARAAKLASLGAGATQLADTLKAQRDAADATVAADQALVDTARLNLDFTAIRAPIDGRVGLRAVDPGSIVQAGDPTGLVTITQMAPIAVLFSLPQTDLSDILAGQAVAPLPVVVHDTRATRRLATGTLVFVDSKVDQATGQIRLKAAFRNADRALWPGELVTARLKLRTVRQAVTVPETAVLTGQDGPYVYVADASSRAEVRAVRLGPAADGVVVVSSGVAAGETVVTAGQSRLVAGTPISAQPQAGPAPQAAPP